MAKTGRPRGSKDKRQRLSSKRDPNRRDSKTVSVRMTEEDYEFLEERADELRTKLGLPQNAFGVSTLLFQTTMKKLGRLVE